MGLLGLLGCQFSTKELPRSLGELEVLVEFEQLSERSDAGRPPFVFDRVTGTLRNKKHVAIETDAVKILVDGHELDAHVSTGNYGEHHPWQELDTKEHPIVPDQGYAVSVRWTDGVEHPLGVLRTPKRLSLEQFSVPEQVEVGAPITIEWRDLEEACELFIYRTHTYVDSSGTTVLEAGSTNDPEAIRKTIGPALFRAKSGAFPIPQSYLADHDGRRVTGLGVEVVIEKSPSAAKAVSRASRLVATRRVVLRTTIGADDGLEAGQ